MTQSRRNFLKASSATLAISALSYNRVMGANDTVRVAVTGLNGRGRSHVSSFASQDNVEVVALCDTDENVLNKAEKDLANHLVSGVKKYIDYREMMEDQDIDVSSIATPNHWHAIMGIWACQAGKDAYVEKPCSHNILEGKKLVEAQEKYNRIVGHGTQSRSCKAYQEAMEMMREGVIGEVYYAKGLCYKWRDTIGHTEPKEVPEGVHYDLWKGPAPDKPYSRNRHHYNWHWQWDYGNGDIGNQGVHEMDIARWGLGVDCPELVASVGGHFMFDDDQQTPNTMVSTFKYPEQNKMMVFEVRHWMTPDELHSGGSGNVVGNYFLGSEGYMMMDGYEYRIYKGRDRELVKEGKSGDNHFENFISAVRSRKQSDLSAPIYEGHLSCAHIHQANASYIAQDMLHIDPKTLYAIDNELANRFLTGDSRDYRKPFTLPDEV